MKLTYTPTDPGDARMCEVFGITFEAGKAEDVSDLSDAFKAKLKANPQFTAATRGRPAASDAE